MRRSGSRTGTPPVMQPSSCLSALLLLLLLLLLAPSRRVSSFDVPAGTSSSSSSVAAKAASTASTTSGSNRYQHRNRNRRGPSSPPSIDAGDGVLYRTGVFDRLEFEAIVEEVADRSPRMLSRESESSVATNRRGFVLPPDSPAREIVRNRLTPLVRRVAAAATGDGEGRPYELCGDVPVEVRVYEAGAGMAWHRDDVLYEPEAQIEAIVTLDNTSDAATMWKKETNKRSENRDIGGGGGGKDVKEESGEVCSVETDPNSVLLLRAGGAPHCVTTVKRGRRTIVKCAFSKVGSTFLGDEYRRQFGGNGRSKSSSSSSSSDGAAKNKNKNPRNGNSKGKNKCRGSQKRKR